MFSASKVALSDDLAQQIVSAHFGSSRKLRQFEELRDGLFNAAARLELDDGFQCVLKAAPLDGVLVMRYERDIMRAEVESMRLVRERTQAPAPDVLIYDTTRAILPSDFFVMSYLPGIPLNKLRGELPPESIQAIEREMGGLACQMSVLTGERFGYWSRPEAPGATWRNCFDGMLRGVVQDGIDLQVSLHLPYEEFYRAVSAHFDALDEVTLPRLVHWDLWDGNIFIDPQTHRITGLIDFERVMWGDPLIEVFFNDIDPDSHYAQGYGAPLLRTRNAQRRRLLYNIYLWSIMVIECYFRQYETQDQENWARVVLKRDMQRLNEV